MARPAARRTLSAAPAVSAHAKDGRVGDAGTAVLVRGLRSTGGTGARSHAQTQEEEVQEEGKQQRGAGLDQGAPATRSADRQAHMSIHLSTCAATNALLSAVARAAFSLPASRCVSLRVSAHPDRGCGRCPQAESVLTGPRRTAPKLGVGLARSGRARLQSSS